MSWWTSVINGTKAISYGIGSGAQWTWDNLYPPVTSFTIGALTYTANTAFYIIEQGLALRTAIPTLVNNPKARKIVNDMKYIAVNDVLPLITLNAINNGMQAYFRRGYQEDAAWYTPYALFFTGLTIINYGVTVFTWRQGVQTVTRVLVLHGDAPPAFNSNKTTLPTTLCTGEKCNKKRIMSGLGREQLILLGNNALTKAISYIPHVGPTASQVLRVYFNGRYITRLVTPERCERHKAMVQESVLALGLTCEASTVLMDMLLEATIGMPPDVYHFALSKLVLLLHINTAAHMTIPLLPLDSPIYLDPLNVYERGTRFGADVLLAGLKVRVPIDFKLTPGAKPIIPLSTALQFGTKVLNSDISVLDAPKPGFFRQKWNTLKPWVLPPMFRSLDGFINDKIISNHWIGIRKSVISVVGTINSIGREDKITSKMVRAANYVPKTTEEALKKKWGIPRVVTRIGLRLSRKEDFWAFAAALKAWFERHNVHFEVQLSDKPQLPLLGEKQIEAPPKQTDSKPTAPAVNLVPDRPKLEPVLKPDLLISTRSSVALMPAASPDSLFTTRKRGVRQAAIIPGPEVEQGASHVI